MNMTMVNAWAQYGEAVLGVHSLNYPGGGHWVLAWRGRIFDPSPGTVYTSLDGLAVHDAILIGTRA